MALFFQGLFSLSLLISGGAISPEKGDELQDTLKGLHLPTSFGGNGSDTVNLAQLRQKMPQSFWGFLQKEDKLLPHYHIGTKDERAQEQARVTLELLQLFRPCARCGQYKRYGSKHAGGYVMCEDLMQGTKAAYSFGLTGNDDWGVDVSQNLGVPVYQFDCYRSEGAEPSCPLGAPCNQHFVRECIGLSQNDSDSHIFRSLEEHLRRHAPSSSLSESTPRGGDFVLKLDVQGHEWNALLDTRPHVLRQMRQIVVEFHSISHVEFHASFVKALRHLQKAGFLVAHLHGNNYGPMALFGDGRFKLADHLEVTFVNKFALPPAADTACRSTQDKLAEDAVDNPFNFDLPVPQLPAEHDIIKPSRVHVLRCYWWCGVYAFALGIGPFVLMVGFIATFLIILGLLISGPKVASHFAGPPSKVLFHGKRTSAGHTRRSQHT